MRREMTVVGCWARDSLRTVMKEVQSQGMPCKGIVIV